MQRIPNSRDKSLKDLVVPKNKRIPEGVGALKKSSILEIIPNSRDESLKELVVQKKSRIPEGAGGPTEMNLRRSW